MILGYELDIEWFIHFKFYPHYIHIGANGKYVF
jgi:hypothetical protein